MSPLKIFPLQAVRTLLAFSLLVLSLTSAQAQAQLRAERITEANAGELIQAGPDAIGGIGDWFLGNGTLCAVISDVPHESQFSTQGGVLVDLGFCHRADDYFDSSQILLDASQNRPVNIDRVEVQVNDREAIVRTWGERDGVMLETRYQLSIEQPGQLVISHRIERMDDSESDFNFMASLWANYHSMETFVHASQDPGRSTGFVSRDFVTRGVSAISEAAQSADTLIFLSPSDAEDPISYGWQRRSAQRHFDGGVESLPSFILTDEETTLMISMAESFYLGDGSNLGWLQLAQIPLLALGKGERLEIEDVIYVGQRADVASVMDQMQPQASLVTGQLEDANAALHIDRMDGIPMTFVRPNADGQFALRLAPGEYRVRHLGSAGRVYEQDFQVALSNLQLELPPLAEVARFNLPHGQPMRLVFVGLDGTESPNFEDSLTGFQVDGGDQIYRPDRISQVFMAGVPSDPKQVELAAGSYRVYATRGPEYKLEMWEFEAVTGETRDLQIRAPQRALTTPGFIASDLHVHSGISFDNNFSSLARVRTFVAEQGEVMVSSEHEVPTNFTPFIEALGVQDQITSIDAAEITGVMATDLTPYSNGHLNFFPYPPDPTAFRNGMINHEDRRMRDILHELRQKYPDGLSQLNHARKNLKLSGRTPDNYKELINKGEFLEHMGVAGHPYNPDEPIDSAPNNSLIEPDPATGMRDIDFDAMELINPGGDFHEERVQAVRKDWLSFLKQGLRITGTANSDSHHYGEQVAVPRTMVAVRGDSIAEFDQAEFIKALKAGNAYGTTGPLLNIVLNAGLEGSAPDSRGSPDPSGQEEWEGVDERAGVKMGQTMSGNQGRLLVTIQNADWIPVDVLSVQINGEEVAYQTIADQRSFQFDLQFERDSFVTLEVKGAADELYRTIYPGLSPYAYTNPIYVDADGDGNWTPPGL